MAGPVAVFGASDGAGVGIAAGSAAKPPLALPFDSRAHHCHGAGPDAPQPAPASGPPGRVKLQRERKWRKSKALRRKALEMAASAASVPAWPPPMMMPSYVEV